MSQSKVEGDLFPSLLSSGKRFMSFCLAYAHLLPQQQCLSQETLTHTHALQRIIRPITFQLLHYVHSEAHAEMARLTHVQL